MPACIALCCHPLSIFNHFNTFVFEKVAHIPVFFQTRFSDILHLTYTAIKLFAFSGTNLHKCIFLACVFFFNNICLYIQCSFVDNNIYCYGPLYIWLCFQPYIRRWQFWAEKWRFYLRWVSPCHQLYQGDLHIGPVSYLGQLSFDKDFTSVCRTVSHLQWCW